MGAPEPREVSNTSRIKGILYPAGTRFRQLVITGPPGSGKSTRVRALGGWPEEGYLDLSERRWWHSRVLAMRPREVHLGLPFKGVSSGLALFEREWLDADPRLELELQRISLPASDERLTPRDPRRSIVFEFLLPAPETVYEARRERAYRQTHLVDRDLSFAEVLEQLTIFRDVAWHLHQAGISVVIRDDFDSAPLMFDSLHSEDRLQDRGSRSKLPRLQRLVDGLTRTKEIPVIDDLDHLHLAGSRVRIRTELLPIDLEIGLQTIRIQHERSLSDTRSDSMDTILLFDPEEYAERITGFVRLEPGERVRVGSGDQEYPISLRLPEDILPRFEIAHEGDRLALTDLHSPGGANLIALDDSLESRCLDRDRERALDRLVEIYGGPFVPLGTERALRDIRFVNAYLEQSSCRDHDSLGRPGGVIVLPSDKAPIIIGDLHANLDNLLTILTSGRFLEWVEKDRALLLFLGDAVHSEEEDQLAEMDSSVLIMDLIFRLLATFPERVIYLRGNHDSFSHEVSKEGIPQGHLWREHIEAVRGTEYRAEIDRFYDVLPYLAVSAELVACHAGPPREAVTRKQLVDIRQHKRLAHQVTWNRLKSPSKPAGYGKRDVAALRRALGVKPSVPLVVSHNPPREGSGVVWLGLGGIEHHHLVYSADPERVAVLTRVGRRLFPLEFHTEAFQHLVDRS